ncbi:MAG TPA: hypothetical protein VHS09_15410, partial [Polyangiaceae bacterium]|nr:hypothetical protein [Polyangiaceae bacterium]
MNKWSIAIAGLALGGGFVSSAAGASGCSSSSPNMGQGGFVDAGVDQSASDAAGDQAQIAPEGGDGGGLMPFAYPADPGPGAFYVTISGESNALTGYPFPPDNFSSDTYMPDGWQFEIVEYIVVVDKVTLWSNPDLSTTDQSQHGAQVADLDGPFVIDLHKGGKIVGQGGYPELATPLGVIASQNDNGNAAFDTSGGTRYGFGFSTVPATYAAYDVNLDESEAADFALMVQKGYSVFYRGTAVWKGDDPGNPYPCVQTNAGAGEDAGLVTEGDASAATYVDGGYDFSQIDKLTFSFTLGFSTPTNYVNCQNMSGGGQPLPGEDYARGVSASASQSSIAQVTVHMDHPFWESFQEDTPVHWDDIAAQYVGATASPVAVNTEDFVGVAFHPWTDKTGTPVPWRNCVGSNYSPPGNGQMFFSTLSVPIDPHGTCSGPIGQDYTQDD